MKWTNKFGTAIASALAFGLVLTGCALSVLAAWFLSFSDPKNYL